MADDIIAWSQTILAAALLIATAVYAWHTASMAKVAKQQMEWSKKPLVAVSPDFVGPTTVFLRVHNAGAGVARDVRVEVRSEPEGLELSWAHPSILPGQGFAILLPEKYRDLSTFSKLNRIMSFISVCDIEGKEWKYTDKLELSAYGATINKTPTIWEKSDKSSERKRESKR